MGWYDDYGPGSYENDDYHCGSEGDYHDEAHSRYSDEEQEEEEDDEEEDDLPEEEEVTLWHAISEVIGDRHGDFFPVLDGLEALEEQSESGDVLWPLRGTEAALGRWEAVDRYAALEQPPDANVEAAVAVASAFRLAAAFDWTCEGRPRTFAHPHVNPHPGWIQAGWLHPSTASERGERLGQFVECAHTVLLFMLGLRVAKTGSGPSAAGPSAAGYMGHASVHGPRPVLDACPRTEADDEVALRAVSMELRAFAANALAASGRFTRATHPKGGWKRLSWRGRFGFVKAFLAQPSNVPDHAKTKHILQLWDPWSNPGGCPHELFADAQPLVGQQQPPNMVSLLVDAGAFAAVAAAARTIAREEPHAKTQTWLLLEKLLSTMRAVATLNAPAVEALPWVGHASLVQTGQPMPQLCLWLVAQQLRRPLQQMIDGGVVEVPGLFQKVCRDTFGVSASEFVVPISDDDVGDRSVCPDRLNLNADGLPCRVLTGAFGLATLVASDPAHHGAHATLEHGTPLATALTTTPRYVAGAMVGAGCVAAAIWPLNVLAKDAAKVAGAHPSGLRAPAPPDDEGLRRANQGSCIDSESAFDSQEN